MHGCARPGQLPCNPSNEPGPQTLIPAMLCPVGTRPAFCLTLGAWNDWRYCTFERWIGTRPIAAYPGAAQAPSEAPVTPSAGASHRFATEERMIRLIAVVFALTLATSVQAMSPAPLHQPDGMITQVREACGAGRVRINGVCVARTTKRHVRREVRRCARWSGGACVRYY